MPEPISGDVIIPDHVSVSKDGVMAEVPAALHEQNLGRLASAGASAHEHFVQFGKILDLSYANCRTTISRAKESLRKKMEVL